MAHNADELRRFQDGETRLVYARRRDNHEVIEFMPDGDAVEMRDRTRRDLMCIVDGCTSPGLKTVSRANARDGFSHLSGGGHTNMGMGMHHLQAQLALEQWVKAHNPALHVELEHTTEDGARRADLMATSPETGKQVALEVQYAALSIASWRERRDSYRAPERDIRDFWIFGHTGAQFTVARGTDRERVKLNALQEAVVATGDVPLWLNPAEGKIAWAVRSHTHKELACEGTGTLVIRPLEEFTLSRSGLRHPELDEIRRNTAQVLEQERAEAEDRERQKRRVARPAPPTYRLCSNCEWPLSMEHWERGTHEVCIFKR